MRTLLCAVLATVVMAQPAIAADLKDLAFMSGCWKTAPELTTEYRECYAAPKAGMLQGSSQTIEHGKTTFFEFSLILEEGEKIVYRPFIKGVQSVDFLLVRLTPKEAVFENLSHDFPQRITYRKDAAGKLVARIEDAGGKRSQEWVMQPQ